MTVSMDETARSLRDALAGATGAPPSDIEAAMLTALEHPGRTVRLHLGLGDTVSVKYSRRRKLTRGKFWIVNLTMEK